jgi:hypothetical protein
MVLYYHLFFINNMKNLIHINFNSDKWGFVLRGNLKKYKNTCIGYSSNIKKFKTQKNLKVIGLNNKFLFFHKKLMIENNFFKKFFFIIFFKLVKFITYIYLKIFRFDNYITTDDMTGPLNLIFINLFMNENKKIYLYLDNRYNNENYFINERLKFKRFITNNKIFISRYKNICRKIPNSKNYISFFEKDFVSILDNLNCLPRNPFTPGNLKYKKLIVKYYNEEEHIRNKLNLKGGKFDKRKKSIFQKYKLNNKRKLIIIGLTNWHKHYITNLEEDYLRNEIMIKIILKNYKIYNLLVSLHPKQKIKDYHWIVKKYKIKIIREPLINVIPIANLFITSFGSSVLQWAKICKIKSIVFNFYKDKNINLKNSNILSNITSKKNIKKKLIYI